MGKDRPKGKRALKASILKRKKLSKQKSKLRFYDEIRARLMVKNLSPKTNVSNFKQHFEPFGKIKEVKLVKEKGKIKHAYVIYSNAEYAKQAHANRNNQPFLGRCLQIDYVSPDNDSFTNTDTEIKHEDLKIKSDPEESHDEHDDSSKNANVDSDVSKPKTNVENKESIKRKARLVIRNVPFKATEDSLKAHFQNYGDVLESILLKKQNGDLIGCGFIQFRDVQSATKAILKTNAKPFLGRPIFVDWAVPKNKYVSYVTQKQDEEEQLKNDVKSEPESEDEEKEVVAEDLNATVKSENSDDSEESQIEDDEEPENDEESEKIENENIASKRVSANDAEDGRTVFFKNVPFNVTNDDLEEFAKQFGEINYAVVCMDKLTEHSKGTAFVRFKAKEDADICLSAGSERMILNGQQIEPMPALFRDRTNKKNLIKKNPKDLRNLYLIKEGLILANSKAAVGVSTSDMAKRLSLEQRKSDMLKNLNRFISRYRLTMHNIPSHLSDDKLRNLCISTTNVKPYAIKECRIMRNLKGPFDSNGQPLSKGFGFISFTKHEDALKCLRLMNNNPSVFDKNNRPIVAFSIEDKAVINARNKRLEKSKLKNPNFIARMENKTDNQDVNRKRKSIGKNHGKTKKSKISNNNVTDMNEDTKQRGDAKNLTRNSSNAEAVDDFIGETGKPGSTIRMRNKYKLKQQAAMHKENVKQSKKQSMSVKRNKKMKMKEKIKQPRQKLNQGNRTKLKKLAEQKNEKEFSDLVAKYKTKLISNSVDQKIKSKWYEKS